MNNSLVQGKVRRHRPVLWVGILGAVTALLTFALNRSGDVSWARPERVLVSTEGYTTNESGQRLLQVRLRNNNAKAITALTEVESALEGQGVFVVLQPCQDRTVGLPLAEADPAPRLKTSCFARDTRLLTKAFMVLERLRGRKAHEISQLLFVVDGSANKP